MLNWRDYNSDYEDFFTMNDLPNSIETKTGTININGIGTRYWVQPRQEMMSAIFGQSHDKWDEMLVWCSNTFARAAWGTNTEVTPHHVLFARREDRTAFMLKWC